MSQEASTQTMCSSHFSANRRLDLCGLLLGSPWPVASPASVSLFPDFWIHCRRLAPCGLLLGPLWFCHFPVARFCLDPHGLLAPGWLFVPPTCFIICTDDVPGSLHSNDVPGSLQDAIGNPHLDLYGLLLGSPWPVTSPASVSLFPDFFRGCRLAPYGLLLEPLWFCHFPVARLCLDPHGLLALRVL